MLILRVLLQFFEVKGRFMDVVLLRRVMYLL